GNIVLEYIADDPDARQIGDRKCSGGAGESDTGCGGVGDVLADDDTGDGRIHIHQVGGVIFIYSEQLQLLIGGNQIGFRVVFSSLRLIKHRLRNGAVLEEIFRANVVLVGKLFIVHGLEIRVE